MHVSVIIPTYQREEILLDTLRCLRELKPAPAEIILVDQTSRHQGHVEEMLISLEKNGDIRWIRLAAPSIPYAMNVGLQEARNEIVLFLDDDIMPDKKLIEAHLAAHKEGGVGIVAGRVIQPWDNDESVADDSVFRFASRTRQMINEFMGGNFSIKRSLALERGGFDENFVRVAYQFEAEFAFRLRQADHKIYFEPKACIHHLKAKSGGTRLFGDHLTTFKPDHAVGAYYYIFRTWTGWKSLFDLFYRPVRSVATRHHLYHPWWIPVTLIAETLGLVWATALAIKGPRYISAERIMK